MTLPPAYSSHLLTSFGFTQPDPLAGKYSWLSPYAYCAADPINAIDPTGEDICILLMDDNYGIGHLAMLIQDTNGRWRYYSVNGDNLYFCFMFFGGRKFDDIGIDKGWDSPQSFLDSSYNERTNDSEEDKENKSHYDFQEGFLIETTPEQDAVMSAEFKNISENEEYSLLHNNCAHAVQRVMYKAGLMVTHEAIYETETNVIVSGINGLIDVKSCSGY